MLLRKIYSNPPGLFQPVTFKEGVNYIFGKKLNNPKESLNSIGKSTFLDLIDFCLLSSYKKHHNPRLVSAHSILKGYNIVLEFDIDNTSYRISRSVDTPSIVSFGVIGKENKFSIDDLKHDFASLIFRNRKYDGAFSDKWFRNLISFYLKIQKYKQYNFTDPILFTKEIRKAELNIYHFYLMGIDNTLAVKNNELLSQLKKIAPAVEEVDRLVKEKYELKDVSAANNELNRLRLEIKKLEEAIKIFKLGEQYADAEKTANGLTGRIKDLWYESFNERKRIELYKESYEINTQISSVKIKNIYKQLNEDFAVKIKKTLDEAIKFREQLSESRKTFLNDEISRLEESIKKRDTEIFKLEEERSTIFKFLSTKEAINDLTEAFYNLNEKRNKLYEIESSIKTLNDLEMEYADLSSEQKKMQVSARAFKDQIQGQELKLFEYFTNVYTEIYPGKPDNLSFSINVNPKLESILDINVSFPDMFGKGKNQTRTLIYDLMILFHSIDSNYHFPRFLIHDGIFDGVDKAHFISIIEYLQKQSNNGKKFQYITTINEEGTLSNNFGNADKVNPKTIEDEAILILTPKQKLFGKDFNNM